MARDGLRAAGCDPPTSPASDVVGPRVAIASHQRVVDAGLPRRARAPAVVRTGAGDRRVLRDVQAPDDPAPAPSRRRARRQRGGTARELTVRHLMSADVFTVREDDAVRPGGERDGLAHVRHVPVVDAVGALVG